MLVARSHAYLALRPNKALQSDSRAMVGALRALYLMRLQLNASVEDIGKASTRVE